MLKPGHWQERIDAALCEGISAAVQGDSAGALLAQQNAILVQLARGLAERLDLAEAKLIAIDQVVAEAERAQGAN